MCGFAPSANPALDDARKGPRKKLDAWDDDPFSGLLFFAEIQRSFGWQPFIDVFAEYRALAEDQQPTSDEDKRGYLQEHESIAAAWAHARAQDLPVDSDEVQQIAARHTAWIAIGWQGRSPSAEALVSLAEMYVADERFAVNYGGVDGATYVRDGLVAYSRTL